MTMKHRQAMSARLDSGAAGSAVVGTVADVVVPAVRIVLAVATLAVLIRSVGLGADVPQATCRTA